ncbi:MAG: hypothetical protein GY867_04630 [bacterium]|nr:hypothetical protein [bacterium]
MSRVFFFVIFVAAVILFFGLAQILLLRHLNRVWWERRWIRRLAWALPTVGIVFFVLAVAGEYYRASWLAYSAAPISALAVIAEVSLMLSLPVSGLIHLADRLITKYIRRNGKSEEAPSDPRRRLFLKGAAAAVPLATITTGFSGVGRAFGPVQIERKQFAYKDLPADLEGLRILHLSDIHLRHYVTLSDLEEVMIEAERHSPDLVLLTGDVADDLAQLPDAMRMITALQPRLGAYASLGNHEYFRGVERVRSLFDRSGVPLFVDKGTRIPVGDSSLFVGGIDDPVSMRNVDQSFLRTALDKTLIDRGENDFTIVMSHRPDVFTTASAHSVDLTLAGHTHGGQIGLFGRSFLERSLPEKYLWGHYHDDDSQLYTSCGVGHWFPFRLGCPPEAPIIELHRA